jgi:hypothetical protein
MGGVDSDPRFLFRVMRIPIRIFYGWLARLTVWAGIPIRAFLGSAPA